MVSSIYLLSVFPRLISAAADWMSTYFHTWCGLSVNLGCRSETCCTRLAEIQDPKNCQKISTCAPSHNFVRLYIRNYGTYRQSEKIVKQQHLPHVSLQYRKLRPTIAAEILLFVWGTPGNFNGFRVLEALLHGTLVVGVSQTLRRRTARGRHLYSAGRPSRNWALAHILVL